MVACPLAKLMAVELPKATAVPEELVTVGVKDPMELAPPKVRLCGPGVGGDGVAVVSSAVMVRLSPAPALGEPVAGVRTNWLPQAGAITVAAVDVAVARTRCRRWR